MENEELRQENKQLRQKLEQAYEFMKQFVIKGKNMLDAFLEKTGQVIERVLRR
jgi:L-serine deaminase